MLSHREYVDAETRNGLHDLVVEFTWKLDHAEPAGFADLFEPDGTFTTPQGAIEGAEALASFANNRTGMIRTSRSVLSNHRLVRLSDRVIEGTVLATLFIHDGDGRGEPLPFSVAEYRDVYVQGDDGTWRFRRRQSIPLFVRPA